MRYNFYSDISMSFYLVVVLLYKCNQCQDVCQQPDLLKYEKVIYVNNSYLYSHHYNYTMRITLNQPNPVKNRNFKKLSYDREVKPNFQFKYYESQVDYFKINYYGSIDIESSKFIGHIQIGIAGFSNSGVEVLDEKDLFAVRWPFKKKDNDKHELASEVIVPVKWIKSGTLVEYEPMGESCAKYNTSESCQNARSSDIACIWCDKNNTCIDIYDQNTDYLKENNCRVKHTTAGITEENGQNKSLQYLYVVIPLVVSFFALCIGCVIWRWLYMKKKRNL
ncbi:unnamed protein product [Schistosoma rodhaini]|nr:unnamed protein product [Schistosoma rodhaini]CAH8537590.1 unnamed protein product [Schistosoma rodhaini]